MNISNISSTNTTNPMEIQLLQITVVIVVSMQVVNFLIGLPLNIYMVVLLTQAGGLEGAILFTISQSASEIFYALSAPLYVMYVVFPWLEKPQQFFTFIGMITRLMFQCLVCVERYLAVVHPITFLKFKPLKYQLTCLTLAWISGLTCCIVLMFVSGLLFLDIFGSFYVVIVMVELFCCFSILKVLKKPTPGNREDSGMSNTKKKAFRIISVNLLTHLIQMVPLIVIFSLKHSFSIIALAVAASLAMVVNIGVGLMPPFCFLHRAGKLKITRRINN